MGQEHIPAVYLAGTILHGRYVIEELLGQGGFGAVYLVSDQQTGELAALKELRDQDANEKDRLRLECEILQRVDHPSLPQVRGVLEENQRISMLMEYIEGPNLEMLRQKQPMQRFSFMEVLALIQPIVEAVTYLHRQDPPLMHRDIKPANIIVPINGDRTVLVDFGIAKEYHDDATTTAVRHCSPGYSAPEQYSSMGTDPRADVYGLGATCYTLLAGTTPIDALQRMTKLANKAADPLVPITELVPNVPPAGAAALQRALSINYGRRFPTVDEFWQAFISDEVIPFEHMQEQPPLVARKELVAGIRVTEELQKRPYAASPWQLRVALIGVLLLLIGGLSAGFWTHTLSFNPLVAVPTHTSASHPAAVVPTTTIKGDYPVLKTSYAGTLDDVLTQKTSRMTLTDIQQSAQAIQGTFTDEVHPRRQSLFSGVVDISKHLLFSIPSQGGQSALFFDGVVSPQGFLVGNYCDVDDSGQCVNGDYGLWSLGPLAP